MTERRFNEAEVAAIFQRATEEQHTGQRQLPSGEGMTLAELQAIGREAGIAPELVSRAAVSIDRVGAPVERKFLGLPIGVGRTVELGRTLTDAEWERLVVDLRETFDARGNVRQDGTLRQWTNGNLQALLEPVATGHRLRLRTTKGDSRSLIVTGLTMVLAAGVSFVAAGANTGFSDPGSMTTFGLLGAMGASMFAVGALRVPKWARLRQQQMETIAERLAADQNPASGRLG
jgi:hypothetical protein